MIESVIVLSMLFILRIGYEDWWNRKAWKILGVK